MTKTAYESVRLFCSYSHKDERYFNRLRTSLRRLRRQGVIEEWHDRKIVPGQEWEDAIDKNLKISEIVLLLISPDFVDSDYAYEKEMKRALDKHERGEARVIPIIVRPTDWEEEPFGKLQALPKNAKPITRWSNKDEAWLDVVRGIRKAVEELTDKPSEHEQEAAVAQQTQRRAKHTQQTVDRKQEDLLRRYRECVESAWADGELHMREVEWLRDLANNELGLSPSTATDIEREVMGDTIEAILERQEEEDRRNRLDELYAQARRLHRDQEWQAVVEAFDQIHAVDPEYPDPEGLLVSARARRRVAAIYDQGLQHMEAEEWPQALECFEEVQRLEPGYRDTESLLSRVRHELTSITASKANRVQLLRTLEHTKHSIAVAFSPDGQLLASGAHDKEVRLWRVEDGALLHTLEGHTDSVSSVAFSPDGRLLASASVDKTVRLWRVEDGAPLRVLKEHKKLVSSVAFSPDGRLLASGAFDKTVRLWGVEDGAPLRVLKGHKKRVCGVAFSPDGRLLASGSTGNWGTSSAGAVRLWKVEDGALLHTLEGHTMFISSVAFSPDGRLLASASDDKTVRLWRVEDGASLHTLRGHTGFWPGVGVRSVAFSPDGQLLASSGSDKTVRLWRVEDGAPLRVLKGHTGGVLSEGVGSVAFSPDGRLLASAGLDDKMVRLWGIA